MTFPFNFFLAAFASRVADNAAGAARFGESGGLRTNLVDDSRPAQNSRYAVPLAGGLAVLTGMLLPLAAGAILIKLGGEHCQPDASYCARIKPPRH